jgi:hypothetical protein
VEFLRDPRTLGGCNPSLLPKLDPKSFTRLLGRLVCTAFCLYSQCKVLAMCKYLKVSNITAVASATLRDFREFRERAWRKPQIFL